MASEIDDVRRRIQQKLPDGRCTRCQNSTGKTAPHYAKLDLEEQQLRIWLPMCADCVRWYIEMAAEQMPNALDKG